MTTPSRFLMGLETECLTAVRGKADVGWALGDVLDRMTRLSPSLRCPGGFFNGYGRVYIDGNQHLELASAECASPYELAGLVERQQRLIARAVADLKQQHGIELLLANNNHSGRLRDEAPTSDLLTQVRRNVSGQTPSVTPQLVFYSCESTRSWVFSDPNRSFFSARHFRNSLIITRFFHLCQEV